MAPGLTERVAPALRTVTVHVMVPPGGAGSGASAIATTRSGPLIVVVSVSWLLASLLSATTLSSSAMAVTLAVVTPVMGAPLKTKTRVPPLGIVSGPAATRRVHWTVLMSSPRHA
jgi:hypothetical protein